MRRMILLLVTCITAAGNARSSDWWEEWTHENELIDHHNWWGPNYSGPGHERAFWTAPSGWDRPFKWKRTVAVGTGTSSVHIEVGTCDWGGPDGNWELVVVVNGQRIFGEEIMVSQGWRSFDVSLGAQSGQTVDLELWNAMYETDWWDWACWDNVYLSGATGSTGDGGDDPPPPPDNYLPLATAGPDQTLEDADGSGSEPVSLDGSGSGDPDGTIVSYVWKEGGVEISTDATVQVNLSVGRHYVTLQVTDDDGAVRMDTTIIDVVDNFLPVADAGSDQTVQDDNLDDLARVSLDGSGSYDRSACGFVSSHVWTEDGSVIATGANPQVDLPVGVYTITLTVTDNRGDQASDTVCITVEFQDSDADGLADTWEYEYFSDLSESAKGDFDEDGAVNIAEFARGTDPTDDLSFPTAIAGPSGLGCSPAGPSATAAAFLLVLLVLVRPTTRRPSPGLRRYARSQAQCQGL
jgi:hypothetical protein